MFEKNPYLKLTRNHFDFKNLTSDDVSIIYKGLDLLEQMARQQSDNTDNQINLSNKLKDAIEHNRK